MAKASPPASELGRGFQWPHKVLVFAGRPLGGAWVPRGALVGWVAPSCALAGPNVRKLRPTQGKAAQGSSSESGLRWAAGTGSVGPGRHPVGGRGFLAVGSGKPGGHSLPFRRPGGLQTGADGYPGGWGRGALCLTGAPKVLRDTAGSEQDVAGQLVAHTDRS